VQALNEKRVTKGSRVGGQGTEVPGMASGLLGARGHDRAFPLADMSASSKAATCRRTPNQATVKVQLARKSFNHNLRQGRSRQVKGGTWDRRRPGVELPAGGRRSQVCGAPGMRALPAFLFLWFFVVFCGFLHNIFFAARGGRLLTLRRKFVARASSLEFWRRLAAGRRNMHRDGARTRRRDVRDTSDLSRGSPGVSRPAGMGFEDENEKDDEDENTKDGGGHRRAATTTLQRLT
jgi:hypothetical protein